MSSDDPPSIVAESPLPDRHNPFYQGSQRRQPLVNVSAEAVDPWGPGPSEPEVIELSSYYVNEVVSPTDSVQRRQRPVTIAADKIDRTAKQPSPVKIEKLSEVVPKGMVVPKMR